MHRRSRGLCAATIAIFQIIVHRHRADDEGNEQHSPTDPIHVELGRQLAHFGDRLLRYFADLDRRLFGGLFSACSERRWWSRFFALSVWRYRRDEYLFKGRKFFKIRKGLLAVSSRTCFIIVSHQRIDSVRGLRSRSCSCWSRRGRLCLWLCRWLWGRSGFTGRHRGFCTDARSRTHSLSFGLYRRRRGRNLGHSRLAMLELAHQFLTTLKTVFRRLRNRFHDQSAETWVEIGLEPMRERRERVQDGGANLFRGVSRERLAFGSHFIQNRAQTKERRTVIAGLATQLLG